MKQLLKINIAILPNNDISKKAVEVAKELTKEVDSFFGVDDKNYFPHLTIYMLEIPIKNLDAVFEKVKQITNSISPIEGVFGDFNSNSGFMDVEVKKTTKLQKFHEQIIEEINPLRFGYKINNQKKLKNKDLKKDNILKYGFPYAMELYRPHLTLGRLKNEKLAQEKIKNIRWPIEKFRIDTIGVFKSGDHGTCVKLLKKFKLK